VVAVPVDQHTTQVVAVLVAYDCLPAKIYYQKPTLLL
jgi:hypothetical protein